MGYPKALFFTYPDNPSNTKSMATLLAYAGGPPWPLRAGDARNFYFPIGDAKDAADTGTPPN